LEKNFQGLNLTYEVKDGILCHTGDKQADTLEGRVVRIADRIAYINHDIEDAIRAKVISQEDLPRDCLNVLGDTSSQRINNMIVNIVLNSLDKNEVIMGCDFFEASEKLREFMFHHVYVGSVAKLEEGKAELMLRQLYNQLLIMPDLLPNEFNNMINSDGIHRVVCDYIAGMTDRYAVKVFGDIYIPASWRDVH